MCSLVVEDRLGAIVFAFEPVVTVDIEPADGERISSKVHYRNSASVSAALGRVYEQSTALEAACTDPRIQKAQKVERAELLEKVLRELATEDGRRIVERAAGLALVQGQCTGAPDNRVVAQTLLDTIEPTGPELGLWTDGLTRLGALAEAPDRGEALIDAVIDQHPHPAVGARLLFLRLSRMDADTDPRVRDAVETRLSAPPFSDTASASAAQRLRQARDTVRLVPGDPMPPLSLTGVEGQSVDSADAQGRPQLVVFGASWCSACTKALPSLRRLAAAHPELRIIYVLWDGPDDAREFLARSAPVPGDVVWTDQAARTRLREQMLKYVSLPSFVLEGTEGTVLATSDDAALAELGEILGGRSEPAIPKVKPPTERPG